MSKKKSKTQRKKQAKVATRSKLLTSKKGTPGKNTNGTTNKLSKGKWTRLQTTKPKNPNKNEEFQNEMKDLRERTFHKNKKQSSTLFPSLAPPTLQPKNESTQEILNHITSNKINHSLVVDNTRIYPMSLLPTKSATLYQKKDVEDGNRFASLSVPDSDDEDVGPGTKVFNFAPASFNVSGSGCNDFDIDIDPDL